MFVRWSLVLAISTACMVLYIRGIVHSKDMLNLSMFSQRFPAEVNTAATTLLQLNGTDVAMTADNNYVLQQIMYEMLADVSTATVTITAPMVSSRLDAVADVFAAHVTGESFRAAI